MTARYRKHIFFLLLIVAASLSDAATIPLSLLKSIQIDQKNDECIIQIEFSQKGPAYKNFILSDPQRLIFDFSRSILPETHLNYPIDCPYIQNIRASQNTKESVRLVLETMNAPEYLIKEVLPGKFKIKIFGENRDVDATYKLRPIFTNEPLNSTNPKSKAITSGSADPGSESFVEVEKIPPVDSTVFENDDTSQNGEGKKIVISGQMRNKTAVRISTPHEVTQIQNRLTLEVTGTFNSRISYNISGLLEYDAVFDLTNNYSELVKEDQEKRLELRDTYFDIGFDHFDVRIGKQQIVWGQAVGVFFADVVNPKNLKEYILPDLEEIRIPVWAIDLEWHVRDSTYEFVFIPFPEFNEFGVVGSEFDFTSKYKAEGIEQRILSSKEPSSGIDNSEFGFRSSTFINGWDTGVFFFHGFDKFPVNYRSILYTPDPTIVVTPEYEKMNILGATFSYELMGGIAKGELIYNSGKYFMVSDFNDLDGVVKKNNFEYLLGFDYTFLDNIDTNIQFMHSMILSYHENILEDEHRLFLSLWVQTSLFDSKLEPELFIIGNLRYTDCMIRPKLTWNVADTLRIILGVDLFLGERKGDFGYFKNKDRVYLLTTYYF